MPKKSTSRTQKQLVDENADLRVRLDEADEILRAIRCGEVDALVVPSVGGDQIFTLKGADHSYRLLIEEMSEGALTLTAEGVIVYANRSLAEMLKTPLEKVMGSAIHTWVASDDQSVLQAMLQRGPTQVRRGEVTMLASDGTHVPAYLSINNLQVEEMPGHYYMVATDLTEQKRIAAIVVSEQSARELLATADQSSRALLSVIEDQKQTEESLRETNEYLENLFNYANAPIIVWDPSLVITRFNHSAEHLGGYHADEVKGKSIDILFPQEARDSSLSRIRNAVSGERGETVEIEILRKDGGSRIVLWNFANVLDKDGRTIIATIAQGHDITEHKRAEAELDRLYTESERSRLDLLSILEDEKLAQGEVRKLNADLEQRVIQRTAELEVANKELEAFSYSVSHDLRAPLRSIDGFSQALLEDNGSQLDESGKGNLLRVRTAAQRMGQLIDDVLDLSRIQRIEMSRASVDVTGLVREIIEDLRTTQPRKNVEVVIEPEMSAVGDTQLLRLFFQNLLENAWKFTSKHNRARIECGSRESDGRRVFFVKDDGAGFDMAHSAMLFAPFQRLHAQAEFPGTGVGLASAQRIIHRHGGKIWAESEVEKGATFYFTL